MFELKRELHIKSTVHVIKYSEAASPMMIGFLNPVLVLPNEQYSLEELFFILKHELVHLKRKDVYVKLLFVMANVLHWFNPLVWIMQKGAAVDMKLSCDERVTQGADYEMRKAYTETLLSAFHRQCAKKNGAVIFLFAVVLTVGLGTVTGCSVQRESAEDISKQMENNSQPEETDSGILDEFEPEDELSVEESSTANAFGEDAAVESKTILTFMKEGEPEEKQATLVMGNGYSLYLPDGEWQKEGADMWRAAVNADVRLWVMHYEKEDQVEWMLLSDDGYEQENGELVKQENELIYKSKIYEDDDDTWCVFYCYPMEAEEGWGRELPVIADTFAVTVS